MPDLSMMAADIIAAMKKRINTELSPVLQRVELVECSLRDLPTPKDGSPGERGADGINGKDGAPGTPGERGADGINGKDGAPGTPGERGADGINGKDGAPGTPGERGADGINGKDGAPGTPGERGADGINGKSITLDDIAPLIETAVARAALEYERRAADTLQRAIDKMPEPQPGKDGFSADGLQLESLDGGRTIRIKLMQGEREIVRELKLSVLLDRGIYKSGMQAEAGDGVTYGGSFWIAQRDTDGIPGKSPDWRLAVKRGQDGKDLRT